MYRLREYMNTKMLKNIYNSLIYSHLVYGIQVWGSACETELKPILILQKKAVRMMVKRDQYQSGSLVHCDPIFKELKLLKVKDIFKFHVAKFIYSALSFDTPSIFFDWFRTNHTVHNYNTISNTNINMKNYFEINNVSKTNILHTQGSKLINYGGKMMKVEGPLLWNNLSPDIRNSESVYIFKYSLKNYLIGQY